MIIEIAILGIVLFIVFDGVKAACALLSQRTKLPVSDEYAKLCSDVESLQKEVDKIYELCLDIDENICNGKCGKGTRKMVSCVVERVAALDECVSSIETHVMAMDRVIGGNMTYDEEVRNQELIDKYKER